MNKINIDNLVIEITRRCNLKCKHCLRGRVENIDIDNSYIDMLFSNLDYVSSLTITGGEPSLAVNKIRNIIESAKFFNVDIGSFYIATNAHEVNKDFVLACIELYMYCSDNEISAVNYSNDEFHKLNQDQVKLLSQLKFVYPRYDTVEKTYYTKNKSNTYLIKQGRQKIGRKLVESEFSIEDYHDTMGLSNNEVYLNCLGEIINGCDWSFKNQSKYKICDVKDFHIDRFNKYAEKWENENE